MEGEALLFDAPAVVPPTTAPCIAFLILAMLLPLSRARAGAALDTLIFGSSASEKSHALIADNSEIITGGLGEPARRLLPPSIETWEGGSVSFTLKVDPALPTYITGRFWGDDTSPDLLILRCEGKQIGYRHLGDIDVLDFGSDSGSPALNGRFYYTTSPLPLEMTRGKRELHFEIHSTGRIWGYGTTFEQYQKPMKDPTRGLYRVYTHTTGCFTPPADEKQGLAITDPPVRSEPGSEILDRLESRVNHEVDGILKSNKPLGQMQMIFLAQAYHVKWTAAYHNPKVVEQIATAADAFAAAFRRNPELAQSDSGMYNAGWFGLGPAGEAVHLLAEPLQPTLDQEIDDGAGGKIQRRAAWADMFVASRDWHRQNRRLYTNQSMITDLNIQRANRGVAAVDPKRALPEAVTLHYLYESIGLQPWLGSDTPTGPAKPLGSDYYQLTPNGLTRELGYVGYYGEVLDWVTQIYDSTRPSPDQPGDPKIKAQLAKIANARAVFRYPALDAQGYRAMRIETVVGWRDEHYPGDVCYGERTTWDASPLYAAAATLDPDAVGYAQQMFADNQFFESIRENINKENGLRVTTGLLGIPDQYQLLKSQPSDGQRLPMSVGQPDFVFADEEDGVVAVKRGQDILYTSLYWRSRYAVNFLARVHYVKPDMEQIAVVHEDVRFEPGGLTYTRPDWINMGFGNGGVRYPGELHSAFAGEKLPIAKIPPGEKFRPGDESPQAGRGTFYSLSYGSYLIGMNTTSNQTFALEVPRSSSPIQELQANGSRSFTGSSVRVGPRSTVVLYSPSGFGPAQAN